MSDDGVPMGFEIPAEVDVTFVNCVSRPASEPVEDNAYRVFVPLPASAN